MRINTENYISYKHNMINRKYKELRQARNHGFMLTGMNFVLAAAEAQAHNGFFTILFGGLTCLILKSSESIMNAMSEIRPTYKEIVDRAKKINSLKKIDIYS